MMNRHRLLTCDETGDYLRIAPQTLANWRVAGKGPAFVRIGSRVMYRAADLDAYIASNTYASTTEADAQHA